MQMEWRALISKLPGIIFLFIILFLISQQYRREEKRDDREKIVLTDSVGQIPVPAEIIKRYFPAYMAVTKESEVAYQVWGQQEQVGMLIVSTPVADEVIGFAGKVPVVLAVGTDNKIIGLSLLDNQESPGFIKRIDKRGFFDSWNGKTPEEAVGLNVEAVSGASMSSGAVKENVSRALTSYLQLEAESGQISWDDLIKDLLGYIVVLLALISMFPVKKLKKYRWVLLLASIVILGFWNGYFLSFTLLYGWLLNGIPWGGKILLPVMALLAFVIPLFFGKAYYCYYLCPFGAAQELAGKLRKKKIVLKGSLKTVLKYTRWAYFILVLGLLLAGTAIDLTLFEPLAAFMFSAAGRWVIAMALLFLLLAVFFARPWCNYFCLTGQLLEIIRSKKVTKSSKRILIEWGIVLILVIVTGIVVG